MAPVSAKESGNISSVSSPWETGSLERPPKDAEGGSVQSMWRRYETVKYTEVMENALLEEAILNCESLQRSITEIKDARGSSPNALLTAQSRLRYLQELMNRDPFVMVLIDGNHMIFNASLIEMGEEGGRQVAAQLRQSVHGWVTANVAECPQEVRVACRVYADLQALSVLCVNDGIIEHYSKILEFAFGFTSAEPLFDWVHVGSAGQKMSDVFKLHIFDYHCRQVILGCNYNVLYPSVLKHLRGDQAAIQRMTLLEVHANDGSCIDPAFRTAKFPGIFQEQKVRCVDSVSAAPNGQRSSTSSSANPTTHDASKTPKSKSKSLKSTAAAWQPNSSAPSLSWASTAAKKAHAPLADMTRSPSPPIKYRKQEPIRRNRKGQRLDVDLEYNRDDVQRIKKLRSCNQHFIGNGCCHYNAGKADKCPHSHDLRLSKTDLQTLRVVARETPCKRGHDCEDSSCIYGHKCPFPAPSDGSLRGAACLNGSACRFPRSMHGMDLEPVKTLKIT